MCVGSTKDLNPASLIWDKRNWVQANEIMRGILTQASRPTKCLSKITNCANPPVFARYSRAWLFQPGVDFNQIQTQLKV
jgi:hypothetical protein